MSKWKRKIEKLQTELAAARKQRDEEKQNTRRVIRKVARPGRPRISKELLEEAEFLAYTNPIPHVALKLNIALSTLYDHGITRKNLNAKIAAREKETKDRTNQPLKPA